MTPVQNLILNKQFEKSAGVLEYAQKAPGYIRSVFTPEALRQAKNIAFSYPGQIKQGPIDLYNKGLVQGSKSIWNRLLQVNAENPAGAPIAFIAPKVVIPSALVALGLKGDSGESKNKGLVYTV